MFLLLLSLFPISIKCETNKSVYVQSEEMINGLEGLIIAFATFILWVVVVPIVIKYAWCTNTKKEDEIPIARSE